MRTMGSIDKVLSKMFSRKLLVFLTSTGLMAAGLLASSDWTAVALVYVGSQAAVDIATQWRHGK